ncbi:MAG: hypothetical protein NTY36_17160 [Deltaproteobacteria bacterium]|nr:hypothetical protein [Deltaproteobacteria bacterium]
MNVKRSQIGSCLLVAGIFFSLLALAGPAAARNPNLSNWTINLSGDEPVEETWHDYCQEIEVVGSTVHVTYWNYGSSNRLYYRRSTDGGQTWQAKILLYDTNPGGSISTVGRGWKYLAVDGTSVHIAYAAYDSTSLSLYNCKLIYRRSTDNGASFEAARPLAPASGGYWWINNTRIAANSGKVTIAMSCQAFDGAWQGLTTLNSGNGGDTFTATDVASSGDRYWGVPVGDLKRVGDRIYLLYGHDLEVPDSGEWNRPTYCAASLDGGAHFTSIRMSTAAPNGKYYSYQLQEASYSPNIAVDGDNVFVVWTQNDTSATSNDRSLYIRRSGDGGLNFGAPQKLAQNQTGGIGDMQLGQETVSAQGGYVYVVLMTSDGTVYLRRSSDNGAGFSPLQTMGTGAWWPNLVVDPANGAKVHVFWWSTYRYSADGGATFTSPVVFMPWAGCSGNQTGVQMALGPNDTKHFVNCFQYYTAAYGWGDRDIFYRCLPPAPTPAAGNQALRTYGDGNACRYDSMEVASSNWFNFGSRMSAEVWVKLLPGEPYWSPIFAKLPTEITPSNNRLFSLGTETRWSDTPHVIAELGTTDAWNVLNLWGDTAGLVPVNAWTHLAMTYDADAAGNNFKLYKNGQLINSMRATGNVATGTGNFFAGKFWPGNYGGWEMDELRLWSKALSQNDIKANMYRKLAGTESGLNAYYQFNTTTKDMTGHGNDGILNYQESYVSSSIGAPSLSAVNGLLLQ